MDTIPSPEITALTGDIAADTALVKNALAAYKAKGKQGLIDMVPALVEAARKDVADVTAALPQIKAGYKTTEFWLTVSVPAINGVYLSVTGKVLPMDLNIVLGSVVAVYTIVRTLLKK